MIVWPGRVTPRLKTQQGKQTARPNLRLLYRRGRACCIFASPGPAWRGRDPAAPFSPRPPSCDDARYRPCARAWESATRKPTLLLKFAGSFLLRHAERQFLRLLFHDPPRNTRSISRSRFTQNLRCRHPRCGPFRHGSVPYSAEVVVGAGTGVDGGGVPVCACAAITVRPARTRVAASHRRNNVTRRRLAVRRLIGKDTCPVCRTVWQYAQPSHEHAPDQELRVFLERVDEHIGLKAQLGNDE